MNQLTEVLKNLKKAKSTLQAVPGEKIDLRHYGRETECGTLFCAAGWLAHTAYFQKLGLRIRRTDTGNYVLDMRGGAPALDVLFGPHAFKYLFSPYTSSPYDAAIIGPSYQRAHELAKQGVDFEKPLGASDKLLAIGRLSKRIEEVQNIIKSQQEVANVN